MKASDARTIYDCYKKGLNVGFPVYDKHFVFSKRAQWYLHIFDQNKGNVLEFEVVAVYLEPCASDPPGAGRGYLTFDLEGDAIIRVFYTEGEE